MGLTRTHQRQISLKHTRKHKTHAINQPFPAHESQPPRPLFSVSPISGGRKKAAPNTYKWILKINFKKNVPWRVRFFFDLAVQVLGWWGYSHNSCHKGKSERIQTGPKRTTSSQYFASWKTDSAKEFTRSNSHQRQPVKYWFFLLFYLVAETWSQVTGGWVWAYFLPRGLAAYREWLALKKKCAAWR